MFRILEGRICLVLALNQFSGCGRSRLSSQVLFEVSRKRKVNSYEGCTTHNKTKYLVIQLVLRR